ncbi:MAG: DNA adenine methyltransferase YhdJ [Pelotomaculum sp. PtaB.Bin104]|nr:MAG: DNA adenine methyltransferase YhdJ [Pelotomaculum sp. PtaB.Bin104]
MTDYESFLESKRIIVQPSGFDVPVEEINPRLFLFQRDIVRWALKKGRAAIFADCGLGKTPIQLTYAKHVCDYTGGNVLILAPLAVSKQTVNEGIKFGVEVNICRSQADIKPGINITNYEMLHHFRPEDFAGIVLDESSILKAFFGKYRQEITNFASGIEFRLACTATPAPNDLIEIINHAEFLSIMNGKKIIALFFTQNGNTTHSWRLKGHAKEDFWRWMAGWCVALRKPSDLGYDDGDFILPKLNIIEHVVKTEPTNGFFAVEAQTLEERRRARQESIEARVNEAARIVTSKNSPWLVWCDLNRESEALRKAIPGAVEVRGSDSPEHKEKSMIGFSVGDIQVLVTKPSIAGHGMNWQHCSDVVFVGLSDSYEQFYQAVRRCWRFGQKNEVNVHIVIAETEGAVRANIERKEKEAMVMMDNIVKHMKGLQMDRCIRNEMEYIEDLAKGSTWKLYLGDSIKLIDKIESDSCGLVLFSPPFPGMYAYTNSTHDIGNTTTINQMIEHFSYLIGKDKLLRVTMPGRLCCIHLMQLTAMKSRDGYIGIKDYRGRVIQMMEDAGWIYAGEVTIDKNPQIQATRNKERGLLFKSLATDSSVMRMALADYLIYFRKPGDNKEPICAGISKKYNPGGGWITEEEWIEWAAPVWYRQTKDYPGGIRETDCLNVRQARETDDERHLCPLQLGVIERAVKLWSNPGDIVFSPFAGICSEGYQAIKFKRRFIGIELKKSYWLSGIQNLKHAEQEAWQPSLLDFMEVNDNA